jgi:hypothetical protein
MNVPPESFTTWPGCKGTGPMYRNRVLKEIDTEDFSEVIIPYSVELRYEKRLHLQQSYVLYAGADPKIRLQFISQDILELCQARALLVDVVEGLIARLNLIVAGSRIFPKQITAADLEIYIDFESFYCKYCDPMYIGWIALENSMAYYYAYNVKDYTHDYWQKRVEPYFKSLSFATIKQRAEIDYELAHPIIKSVNLNSDDREKSVLNPIKTMQRSKVDLGYQTTNLQGQGGHDDGDIDYDYYNNQGRNNNSSNQSGNDFFNDQDDGDYSDDYNDQDGYDDDYDDQDYYPDGGVYIQDGGYGIQRGLNRRDRKARGQQQRANHLYKGAGSSPRVNPVNPIHNAVNPIHKGVNPSNAKVNPLYKPASSSNKGRMPQQPALPKQDLPQQPPLKKIGRVAHPGESDFRPGFR